MKNKKISMVRNDVVDSVVNIVMNGYFGDEFYCRVIEIRPTHDEMLEVAKYLVSNKNTIFKTNSSADKTFSAIKKYIDSEEDALIIKLSESEQKVACYHCGKKYNKKHINEYRFIDVDNEDLAHETSNGNSVKGLKTCEKCYKMLSKYSCSVHNAIILPNKSGDYPPQCPLFPKKCKDVTCCNNPICQENHMAYRHKKYTQRKWRPAKKFIGGKQGKIITSDIQTGVEVEVVARDGRSRLINTFKYCNNVGITNEMSMQQYRNPKELITPPANLIKLEHLVMGLCENIKKDGFLVNSRCGIHIHLDVEKKIGSFKTNPLHYKSLMLAYSIFEPFFLTLLPLSRYDNRYARSISWIKNGFAKYLSENDVTRWTSKKLSAIWYDPSHASLLGPHDEYNERPSIRWKLKRDYTKYTSISFHSLFRGQGVEVRMLEGTLDPELILKWSNLHHKFIEGVIMMDKPIFLHKKIEKMLRGNDLKKFFLEIVSGACSKEGEYDAVKDFISRREEVHKNSTKTNIDNRIFRPQVEKYYYTDTDKNDKSEELEKILKMNDEKESVITGRDEAQVVERGLGLENVVAMLRTRDAAISIHEGNDDTGVIFSPNYRSVGLDTIVTDVFTKIQRERMNELYANQLGNLTMGDFGEF